LRAASWYSGIANGVGGALAFLRRTGRDPGVDRRGELRTEPPEVEVRELIARAEHAGRPISVREEPVLRRPPANEQQHADREPARDGDDQERPDDVHVWTRAVGIAGGSPAARRPRIIRSG
jgi:hypothetical protein